MSLRTAAALLIAASLLGACGEKEPLRIGFIGELSGTSADLGESGRNGAMLAVERINEKGGINGRRIELLIRDTGSNADSARRAAGELLQSNVLAVVGPMTSGITDAILPQYDSARTVLISPTASAVKLFGRDDYLFRINWTTRDNAILYARHCLAKGYKRVSAATNLNNRLFSESWIQEFKHAFELSGGSVVGISPFDSGAESLQPVIDDMLGAKPDLLLFVANAGDSARLAQQARKVNAGIPLMAAEWAGTDQLIELGGKAVEGLGLLQQFDITDQSERFVDFRERFARRYGREPAFASVLAHDAVTVLADTLKRNDGRRPLKAALVEQGPFQGLQETIRFDANGDTRRQARFATIRDGRYTHE